MNLFKSFSMASVLVIALAIVSDSCTDQKLTLQQEPAPSPQDIAANGISSSTIQRTFNKEVGRPIDRKTALRWAENFSKAKSSTTSIEYFIKAYALSAIMANDACVGISLHYALDPKGALHIIPIGVDVNGKIMGSHVVAVQNGTLDWPTAWAWIDSYNGPVRSHFFGAQTFERLLVDQKAPSVRVTLALNDSGVPQLLLTNASDPNPPTSDDDSIQCPPVCPKN